MTETRPEFSSLRQFDLHALVRSFTGHLRVLKEMGWQGWECSENTLSIMGRWRDGPAVSGETLEGVREEIGDCTRCRLHGARKLIVFGEGDPKADLVFVGEAPGYEEDLQGRPFVGAAGQLLTRIIQAIGRERETVYICNVIKCRPPGNRTPEDDEIVSCVPFLKKQLRAISPDFICTLGSVAARSLLETREPISRLRGRVHTCEGIPVVPTYHPAYLLRNPQRKRDAWEDMKLLMREFESHSGGRTR
ncbi:uracil-DNA glycosylase [Thermodesulfobacteriota bacterium]